MGKIDRRKFLGGALAVIASGTLIRCHEETKPPKIIKKLLAQEKTSIDFYFYPEVHHRTPLQPAIDYASKHGIKRIAFEGLPAGPITKEMVEKYQVNSSTLEQQLLNLNNKISLHCGNDKLVFPLMELKEKNILSDSQFSAVYEAFLGSAGVTEMLQSLYMIDAAIQLPKIEEAQKAGLQVYGIENLAHANQVTRIFTGSLIVAELKKVDVYLQPIMPKALTNPAVMKDLKPISQCYTFLIKQAIPKMQQGRNLVSKYTHLGQFMNEEVVQKRSKYWINNLPTDEPILVVYGAQHTTPNITAAKVLQKNYTVIIDGLKQAPIEYVKIIKDPTILSLLR